MNNVFSECSTKLGHSDHVGSDGLVFRSIADKGNSMIKPACVTEESSKTAVMQTSGEVALDRLSNSTNSSSGRFPPIENALVEIAKNKRLFEENNKV